MKTKIIIVLTGLLLGMQLEAQEKKDRFTFSGTIQTNHIWRGLIITDKPMVSIFASYDLDKSGVFKVGGWGSSAISNDSDETHYKEINYYAGYFGKKLSIALWDLFNTRNVEKPDIWNYSQKSTTHILDLRTSYYFGDKLPLRLELDILLYGTADQKKDPDANPNGEQRYSTYLQLSYPLITKSKTNLSAFAGTGFALGGETHLYGNGKNKFDLVNIGLTAERKLKLSEMVKIPLIATFFWNPSNKIARVQLKIPF